MLQMWKLPPQSLHDRKKLLKMQLLFLSHNVQRCLWMPLINAIPDGSEITREINGSSVSLDDNCRRKVLVLEIRDQCSVFSRSKYLFLFSFFNNRLHFILIHALSVLVGKMNMKSFI